MGLLKQFRILGDICIFKTFSKQILNGKHFLGKHLLKKSSLNLLLVDKNYVSLNIYANFILKWINPKAEKNCTAIKSFSPSHQTS